MKFITKGTFDLTGDPNSVMTFEEEYDTVTEFLKTDHYPWMGTTLDEYAEELKGYCEAHEKGDVVNGRMWVVEPKNWYELYQEEKKLISNEYN